MPGMANHTDGLPALAYHADNNQKMAFRPILPESHDISVFRCMEKEELQISGTMT
jgi:hypothetical protein